MTCSLLGMWTYMCENVWACSCRGQPWLLFSEMLHGFIWDQVALALELTNYTILADQWAPGISLCASPWHWAYKCMSVHLTFHVSSGMEPGFLRLHSKYFIDLYYLTHLEKLSCSESSPQANSNNYSLCTIHHCLYPSTILARTRNFNLSYLLP